MRVTATIRREGVWFVAQCLEVDVASQGSTVDDALANLREALTLYFEDNVATAADEYPTLVATIDVPIKAAG